MRKNYAGEYVTGIKSCTDSDSFRSAHCTMVDGYWVLVDCPEGYEKETDIRGLEFCTPVAQELFESGEAIFTCDSPDTPKWDILLGKYRCFTPEELELEETEEDPEWEVSCDEGFALGWNGFEWVCMGDNSLSEEERIDAEVREDLINEKIEEDKNPPRPKSQPPAQLKKKSPIKDTPIKDTPTRNGEWEWWQIALLALGGVGITYTLYRTLK